jgi:hypothetical protein
MSAVRRYVVGVGWCWLEDGEVVEVIGDSAVVGCGAATSGSELGPPEGMALRAFAEGEGA